MKINKIIIAATMLIVIQSANIFAQRRETTPKVSPTPSTGCVSGNCVNGKGKIVRENGDVYEGDFVNGKFEGQGTYTLKNGNYYAGALKNDKPNGFGKFYNKSLNKLWEGTWKDDVLDQATATVVNHNEKCVSGNCVNGKGKMEYINGNAYEGGFVEGKYDGQGTYTYKNGQVYVGQFSNNRRNGKGKFTFSNGSIYEGSFMSDNFIGRGIYTNKSDVNSNGKFTVGEIVDLQSKYFDTYWGKAEILEIDGDKYKIFDLSNTTEKTVTKKEIRPFTPPVQYEIGQKVEVIDYGIWYKAEIIANEVEYNDHYRVRYDDKSRGDASQHVDNIRTTAGSNLDGLKQTSNELEQKKAGLLKLNQYQDKLLALQNEAAPLVKKVIETKADDKENQRINRAALLPKMLAINEYLTSAITELEEYKSPEGQAMFKLFVSTKVSVLELISKL